MKKAIRILLAVLLVAVMAAVVACSPQEQDPCANGHTFDEGVYEATDCESARTLVQRCKVCGKEQRTQAAPAGHQWNAGVIASGNEPTCTEDGVKTVTCEVCGETKTETVPATGHVWGAITPSQMPTCNQDGVGSAKCEVCGESSSSVVIPATGLHDWDDGTILDGDEPDCENEGLRTFTCQTCGTTSTQLVPATGHTYGILIAEQPATCTEQGTEAHYQCSECGSLFDSQKNKVESDELVIQPLQHNIEKQQGTAPKCTENGIKDYYKCTRCGELFEDALGQNHIDAPQVDPATGHKEHVLSKVDATCTEDGKTEGRVCDVCGKVIVSQKTIPALGHDWGNWYVDTPATCETDGMQHRDCQRVGCSEVDKEVINKTGHKYKYYEARPASCADGFAAHYECETCRKYFDTEYKPVDRSTLVIKGQPNNHIFDDWQDEIPATCTSDGSMGYKQCTVCHNYYAFDGIEELAEADNFAKLTINATGHSYVFTWQWGADHSTATLLVTCEKEDFTKSITATVISEVDPAATCTSDGQKTYTAEAWFDNQKPTDVFVETLPKTGHTEGSEYIQVDEGGLHYHYTKCTVCKERIEDTKTPCTGLESWQTDGTNHWHECAVCRTHYDEATHQEDYVQQDGGTHKKWCEVCKSVFAESEACTPNKGVGQDASGHKVNATWYADAEWHWQECKHCGNHFNQGEHNYGTGTDKHPCTDCGHPYFGVDVYVGNTEGEVSYYADSIAHAIEWIAKQADTNVEYLIKAEEDRSGNGFTVPAGYKVTIDMGGHQVKFAHDATSPIVIETGATLTLKNGALIVDGNATVEVLFDVRGTLLVQDDFTIASGDKTDFTVNGGATLTLPSGTYTYKFNGATCDTATVTVGGARLAHNWTAAEWHWQETYDGKGVPTVTVDVVCDICKESRNAVTATAKEVGRTPSTDCQTNGTATFSASVEYKGTTLTTTENKEYTLPVGPHSYPTTWEHAVTDNFGYHSHECIVCHERETEPCEIVNSYCAKCGHTYTAQEVYEAREDGELKATDTYQFVGIVTKVEISGQYTNIWFNPVGGDFEMEIYGAKDGSGSNTAANVKVGSRITVSGNGKGLTFYKTTFEFNTHEGTIDKIEYVVDVACIGEGDTADKQVTLVPVTDDESTVTLTEGEQFIAIGSVVKFKLTIGDKMRIASVEFGSNSLTADSNGIYKFTVNDQAKLTITVEEDAINAPRTRTYTWKASEANVNNGWKKDEKYFELQLPMATFSVTPTDQTNTGKFNDKDWRLYSSEHSKIKIVPSKGYLLVSVKFTYTDSGVLSVGSTTLTTGVEYKFSEEESTSGATFEVTKNKAFITQIEITYKDDHTHNFTEHQAHEVADCTTGVNTFYYTCDICGEGKYFNEKGELVSADQVFTSHALGHSFDEPDAHKEQVDSTCQKEGVVDHYVCDRCGKAFATKDTSPEATPLEKTTIDKLDHKYDGQKWISDGEGHHYQECSTCDPAVASKARNTANCNAEELAFDEANHWHQCSVCGYYAETAKQEHTYVNDGENCDTCEQPKPHDHQWQEVEAQEPTCQKGGWVAYVKCTVENCGICYDTLEAANAAVEGTSHPESHYMRGTVDHNYDGQPWVTDSDNHWHKCKWCDEIDGKVPHNLTRSSVDDLNHKVTCSDNCGYTATEQHKFGDNYDADCACGEVRAETGSIEIKLSVLTNLDGTFQSGKSLSMDVDKVTFSYSNLRSQSSAIEFRKSNDGRGELYNKTPIPGKITKIEIVFKSYNDLTLYLGTSSNPTGNSKTSSNNNNAWTWTASSTDNFNYFRLYNNASSVVQVTSITIYYEKCEHTYVETRTDGDCKTDTPDTVTKTCIRCGDTQNTTEPAKHQLVEVGANDSTCTKQGNIKYYQCEVCGRKFSNDYSAGGDLIEIPKDGEIVGYAKHSYETEKGKVWSHDDSGHWYYCTVCQKKYNEQGEEIQEAIPHDKQSNGLFTYEQLEGNEHIQICQCGHDGFQPEKCNAEGNNGGCSKCHRGEGVFVVGTSYYSTLQEAITNSNGGTITLQASIADTSVTGAITSRFTLDLGNHDLTANLTFGNSAVVTLQGGNLKGTVTVSGGELTLDKVAVSGAVTVSAGKLTANGATFSDALKFSFDKDSTNITFVDQGGTAYAAVTFEVTGTVYANLNVKFNKAQKDYADTTFSVTGTTCDNLTAVLFAKETKISHTYASQPEQKDETHHTGPCAICKENFDSEHTNMDDGICDDCGYEKAAKAEIFVKITNIKDLVDGKYLIVTNFSDSKGSYTYAFDGSGDKMNKTGNYFSVEVNSNKIEATDDLKDKTFTIAKSGSGYTIQSSSGRYIGQNSDKNGMDESESSSYLNYITFSTGGDITIAGSTNTKPAKLQFYSAGTGSQFKYYTSSQKAIEVYLLTTE